MSRHLLRKQRSA